MKPDSFTFQRLSALVVAASGIILIGGVRAEAQTLFFDDFNGPALNSVWQAYLPSANISAPPVTTYQGAPSYYSFQTVSGASVLRMTNALGSYQRRGWSTTTSFTTSGFRYEARFNTLNQSASTSIDAFMELWVFDPANPSRYDKLCPFGANFSSSRDFIWSSSIDNSSAVVPFNYQNNTWYRLVLQGAPGQNIRVSLANDSGTELIGQTLNHGASAYSSGIELALSQAIGAPSSGSGPSDVAVDWVQLSQVPEPATSTLLACALAGGLFWNRARRGQSRSVR